MFLHEEKQQIKNKNKKKRSSTFSENVRKLEKKEKCSINSIQEEADKPLSA